MTRNLKALGLALVAAFAMSAMVASAASAQNFFQATNEPAVTLVGSDEVAGDNTFVTTAGTTHCQSAAYGASVGAGLTPTSITTTSVSYGTCEVTPIGHAEVDMNDCQYRFNAGSTVNGKKEGTVDIVCGAGEEITVTATVFGTTKCTLHVPPQNGLGEVTYTNIGSGATEEVTIDIHLTGIDYTHTAGTGFGACSAGSGTDGTFEGLALVTAKNASNEHVGIGVTD